MREYLSGFTDNVTRAQTLVLSPGSARKQGGVFTRQQFSEYEGDAEVDQTLLYTPDRHLSDQT